ncbi:MAG: hypothetical protein NC092_10350 [Butyrivibrio sp.]|nr:hypothetical protein [Muribaculum sp.]MCM1553079.1 hypothetical protein [Butyrivibrio sp.]
MSWDTVYDRLEKSSCACGKGSVLRHSYMRMDDWNRTEDGYYGEGIQCEYCSKKYHIEHCIRHFFCPSWEGDGISDIPFLVPIGMSLKRDVSPKYFNFDLDEKIVSSYEKSNIQAVIDDMSINKYSTRLTLNDSKDIVNLYYRTYRKRSLPNIIKVLQMCISNYDSYEWTFEKMQKYKVEEQQRIEMNTQIINDTISKSYKLDFVTIDNKQG